MKRLLHAWWFGFQLLVRLLLACLLIGFGASAIMTVRIELMRVFAIQIPYLGFLLAEFLYVILLCPFILVSYSRHCGVNSGRPESRA